MGHVHSILDTDTHFKINPITRAITNESNKKTTLIQCDHNSERFGFEIPRYIENHDMSLCNVTEVHYFNADSQTKKVKKGIYTVEDLQVSPEDEEKVICSWLISNNATTNNGTLNFLIRFKCVDYDGVVTYAWNTAFYNNILVSLGSDADVTFEEDYVDVIEQWKASVIQTFDDEFTDLKIKTEHELSTNLNAWKAEKDESLTEWKNQTETNLEGWKNQTETDLESWKEEEETEIQQLFGDYEEHWQRQIEVERARIDQFTRLEEGSTTGDAELIDLRVGANGTVYDSAGAAVREQFKKTAKKLNDSFPVKAENVGFINIGNNVFDSDNAEILEGYFGDTNGEFYVSSGYQCFYVDTVEGETTYTLSNAKISVCFYKDETFISGIAVGSNSVQNLTVTTPANCNKMGVTVEYPIDLESYMVYKGDMLPATYEPYELLLSDKVKVNGQNPIRCDVVVIGDSLSKGDDGQPYKGLANIKDWLMHFTRLNIVNNGVWGDTLSGIEERFDNDVLAYSPRYCIVLCGTNDITNGKTTEEMCVTSVSLIKAMIKNNIIPIMLGIPPRNDKPLYNAYIRDYNRNLEYFCNKYGAYFVDVYYPLCNDNAAGDAIDYVLSSSDNLHWTSYGAYLCAKIVYETGFLKPTSNYVEKIKTKWTEAVFPNGEFETFITADEGEVAEGYSILNTADAVFSKETKPNGNFQQVITKPSTASSTMAGLYYDITTFDNMKLGNNYIFEVDVDFEITDHTDDENTSLQVCVTVYHTDATIATEYHKYVEAYNLQKCNATLRGMVYIPTDIRKLKFETSVVGKSGAVLKISNLNAYRLVTI